MVRYGLFVVSVEQTRSSCITFLSRPKLPIGTRVNLTCVGYSMLALIRQMLISTDRYTDMLCRLNYQKHHRTARLVLILHVPTADYNLCRNHSFILVPIFWGSNIGCRRTGKPLHRTAVHFLSRSFPVTLLAEPLSS
jgi:hypothetical protein